MRDGDNLIARSRMTVSQEERLRSQAHQLAYLILDLQKNHTPIPGNLTEQWNRGVDCATATLMEEQPTIER